MDQVFYGDGLIRCIKFDDQNLMDQAKTRIILKPTLRDYQIQCSESNGFSPIAFEPTDTIEGHGHKI